MDWNWLLSLTGLLVGTVVGLTGMGGGAVLTPLLVLVFGVPPNVAISSDLMASLFIKPVGAFVHFRRGTVDRGLVRTLVSGSVPGALLGAALINWLGRASGVEGTAVRTLLGVTLLVAASATAIKSLLETRVTSRAVPVSHSHPSHGPVTVRRGPTFCVGLVGGVIVGMTSVGSGSLLIVSLLLMYPTLSASRLVGTDLAQAIPLVAAAAAGHLAFGSVHVGLTASLLVGALPGAYLGARLSSRAPDTLIRPVLFIVLITSAIKLLGASNAALIATLGALVLVWQLASFARRHRTRVAVEGASRSS